jgi:hypothetical protein
MNKSILLNLQFILVLFVFSCRMIPQQESSTVDWEDFRRVDIYAISSPHDHYQELLIPDSDTINYLFLKIYPYEKEVPGLISGFFSEIEGQPASVPFHEEIVITDSVPCNRSVSGAYIDISRLPREKNIWLSFRERNKRYKHSKDYNYGCQLVTDGKVKSLQKPELYSHAILTGKSFSRRLQNIDSEGNVSGDFSNSIIPYAFGSTVGGIENRIHLSKEEISRQRLEIEKKMESSKNVQETGGAKQYFTCYSGSGHGGSLNIMQFRKNADKTFSVLNAYIDIGSMVNRIKPRSRWPGDSYIFKTKKALIDQNTYKKARKICIFGMNRAHGRHRPNGTWSSHDFISGFRLFDGKAVCEKIYCGYSNSAKSSFYKPLSEAFKELSDLSNGFDWKEEKDSYEFAELITDNLILLYPKFKDSNWWWGKERLIKMSGIRNNTKAIPILIKLLKETRGKVYSDTDSVNTRNIRYILTALDEITGQSLRFDKLGEPRKLNDVVTDYLEKFEKITAE